jgi:inosine-uridine nucleoside N-ribohydrolase
VLLTNPELFVTRELAVRVDLAGAGRGRTQMVGGELNASPGIKVALDLEVAKAASAFVETIYTYAA